jgi:hypothetical protein
MLRAALGLIEERTHAVTSPPLARPTTLGGETTSGESPATTWSREDTREFEPIGTGPAGETPAENEQSRFDRQPMLAEGASEHDVAARPLPVSDPVPLASPMPATDAGHGWPEAEEKAPPAEPPAPESFGPATVQLPPVRALHDVPQPEEAQPDLAQAAEEAAVDEDEQKEPFERLDPLDQPEPWTAAGASVRGLPGAESRNFDWGE